MADPVIKKSRLEPCSRPCDTQKIKEGPGPLKSMLFGWRYFIFHKKRVIAMKWLEKKKENLFCSKLFSFVCLFGKNAQLFFLLFLRHKPTWSLQKTKFRRNFVKNLSLKGWVPKNPTWLTSLCFYEWRYKKFAINLHFFLILCTW